MNGKPLKEPLLTIREVATRLKCHPHTVRRWIWSQRLPGVKVGDLVRVPEAALLSFARPIQKKTRKIKGAPQFAKGALALLATVRKLRKNIKPADVEELERLMLEGEQPPDWSDSLA